jgi:hypothetical protein
MTADQKDTDVSPELMQKLANAIAQGFADQIPSKMLSNENGQGGHFDHEGLRMDDKPAQNC